MAKIRLRQAARRPASRSTAIPHPLTIDDVLALRDFPIICGPQFALDPAGRQLAFCLPKSLKQASRFFLSALGGGEGALHVLDLETRALRELPDADGLGLLSPVWSPDGMRIAVAATDSTVLHPAVIDVESGAMRRPLARNLALPGTRPFFQWLGEETLACEVTADNGPTLWLDVEKRGARASMAAWQRAWAGKEATASRLTSDQPPAALETIDLCTIDLAAGTHALFPRGGAMPERVRRFAERAGEAYPPRCVGQGAAVPPESRQVAADAAGRQKIYLARSDNGTRLLRLRDGAVETLYETDGHLRDVLPSRVLRLPFTTGQGRGETLRCILPPDHRDGERRPAVLWVYPGFSVTDDLMHRQMLLNDPGCFNLHLLAARGFVVLVPGMPVDAEALAGRELAESLADAALPACAAAVAAGFVDPAHIHVAGHSLGGWATLMLVAQTDIFRSGIALAAASNLFASPDDVRLRHMGLCEDGRQAMMEDNYHLPGPPWRMPERYRRNSPLFSVEAIDAPVLLLHGDQDYVEIGQSEQMFGALRALGKRAEFVRYWGEGHVLESPANIRDAWERIIAWLEASSPTASSAGP